MFEIQYDAADPNRNTCYKDKIMHLQRLGFDCILPNDQNYQMTKMTKKNCWICWTGILAQLVEKKKVGGIFLLSTSDIAV